MDHSKTNGKQCTGNLDSPSGFSSQISCLQGDELCVIRTTDSKDIDPLNSLQRVGRLSGRRARGGLFPISREEILLLNALSGAGSPSTREMGETRDTQNNSLQCSFSPTSRFCAYQERELPTTLCGNLSEGSFSRTGQPITGDKMLNATLP